jgi:hypothetical protein
MKPILLTLLIIVLNSFSFAQTINEKYCKEKIVTQHDHSVITTFTINYELSYNQIAILKSNLYQKKSIYNVKTNDNKTEVYVYHLSQVHYEDLKLLIQTTNINLKFISTEITEFKYTVYGYSNIEK